MNRENLPVRTVEKAYLGDSVYAEVNQHCEVVLTTENGYGPTNTIILEPSVVEDLEQLIAFSRQPQTEEEEL